MLNKFPPKSPISLEIDGTIYHIENPSETTRHWANSIANNVYTQGAPQDYAKKNFLACYKKSLSRLNKKIK